MNDTEVANVTGEEIWRLHQIVQNKAHAAREDVEEAKQAAIQCGQLMEDAKRMCRGNIYRWLNENVPQLEAVKAKAYMGIAKTHRHRESHAIDHRQLVMLGIMGVKEQAPVSTPGVTARKLGGRWIKWIGNVIGHFVTLTKSRPISEWAPEEREAVANQLQPVADLIDKLRGGSSRRWQ